MKVIYKIANHTIIRYSKTFSIYGFFCFRKEIISMFKSFVDNIFVIINDWKSVKYIQSNINKLAIIVLFPFNNKKYANAIHNIFGLTVWLALTRFSCNVVQYTFNITTRVPVLKRVLFNSFIFLQNLLSFWENLDILLHFV